VESLPIHENENSSSKEESDSTPEMQTDSETIWYQSGFNIRGFCLPKETTFDEEEDLL
jgi:hypothetical protein